MKRAGFTMIELIFVIVILGILAAVALPKFIGVSEQANAGKCKAFAGTLNRTVGPALWSDSILNNTSHVGSIGATGTAGATAATAQTILDAIKTQVAFPVECAVATGAATTAAGELLWVSAATGHNQQLTFGTGTYDVNFTDGNLTDSPVWTWAKTN